MTEKQTETAIDNIFGGAAIIVGSQWAIEPEEHKELSKCLYGVLELFPVNVENNPIVLQRIFAIFGLVMALIAVFAGEDRLMKTLKGENDGIIGRGKKQKEVESN